MNGWRKGGRKRVVVLDLVLLNGNPLLLELRLHQLIHLVRDALDELARRRFDVHQNTAASEDTLRVPDAATTLDAPITKCVARRTPTRTISFGMLVRRMRPIFDHCGTLLDLNLCCASRQFQAKSRNNVNVPVQQHIKVEGK